MESGVESGDTKQRILRLIAQYPKISIPEIAKNLSLAQSGIIKHIKKLRELGKLVRVGARKGGYWVANQ